MDSKYPKQVNDMSSKIFKSLNDSGFIDNGVEQIFFDKLCQFFFEQWLLSKDLTITMDECSDIYIHSIAEKFIDDLINDGIYGVVDDENGNEIIFLTQKGKDLGY